MRPSRVSTDPPYPRHQGFNQRQAASLVLVCELVLTPIGRYT
jgi:hypothetical protein